MHLACPLGLIRLVIPEHKLTQAIQATVKSLPIVRPGERIHKFYQVRIPCNHESGDWNAQLAAALRQVQRTRQNFSVNAEAVLIVLFPFFDTSWFPIRDHKDLFVGIAAAAQDVHGQFQSSYGVGMIRPHL